VHLFFVVEHFFCLAPTKWRLLRPKTFSKLGRLQACEKAKVVGKMQIAGCKASHFQRELDGREGKFVKFLG
jgi:hypothetical protein